MRVRLELGLAFYLKQEDALAREHFERALVGKPPPALVANVTRFLSVMRAAAPLARVFRLLPGAGYQYQRGLGTRSSSISTACHSAGAHRARPARLSASWAGAAGNTSIPWPPAGALRAGFDLNHREYKGGRFDQTFIAGHVGPRWLISPNTEMSLLASSSQRWWGGSPFNYDIGARLEVVHRLFAGLLMNGRATWSDRTYQQQKFLEGSLMVFSLGASYVLFPTVQVNALAGYQQQETQLRIAGAMPGYWGRVGTNVALPWGFTIGASAEFRWTDYESGWAPFVPDNSARRDQTRILRATLLNRALTVYGFSPRSRFPTRCANPTRNCSTTNATSWKCASCGSSNDSFLSSSPPPSSVILDACPRRLSPIPDYKRRGQALIGDRFLLLPRSSSFPPLSSLPLLFLSSLRTRGSRVVAFSFREENDTGSPIRVRG